MSGAVMIEEQRRWMAAEANFMRGMVSTMAEPKTCEASGSVWEVLTCRFGGGNTMPNYTTQLFTDYWLQVQGAVDDANPLAALDAIEVISATSDKGLFGTPWHWRGTVPHILLGVARPAFGTYVERGLNAYLASRSTQLWLQARAQGVPPAQRSAWLIERTQGTPLAGRLLPQVDGSWSLQGLTSSIVPGKGPKVWPA